MFGLCSDDVNKSVATYASFDGVFIILRRINRTRLLNRAQLGDARHRRTRSLINRVCVLYTYIHVSYNVI